MILRTTLFICLAFVCIFDVARASDYPCKEFLQISEAQRELMLRHPSPEEACTYLKKRSQRSKAQRESILYLFSPVQRERTYSLYLLSSLLLDNYGPAYNYIVRLSIDGRIFRLEGQAFYYLLKRAEHAGILSADLRPHLLSAGKKLNPSLKNKLDVRVKRGGYGVGHLYTKRNDR